MNVKLWGVRGSLPSPHSPDALEKRLRKSLKSFFELGFSRPEHIDAFVSTLQPAACGGYGGNTPCLEVRTDRAHVLIDGGSGLRAAGYELMEGACGRGQGQVHLVMTHFHWDHLMGLPFFTPLFVPGNEIHVYAVQPELPEVFATVFRKPYFPLELGQLGAKIIYHRLEPRRPFVIGDIELTPYQLDHPDPCWGYRIVGDGRVLAHCVDTECRRVSRADLGPDLPLYQGVDLMVFDAQYTLMETVEKVDWGHAAASLGLDIALREQVGRVLFMHYDPAASDDKILAAETQARKYYELQRERLAADDPHSGSAPTLQWAFAVEGMRVEV